MSKSHSHVLSRTWERRADHDSITHIWREWSSQHRLLAAAIAGITAVHIASLMGFWMGGFGLTRLDYNSANGSVLFPEGTAMQKFIVGGLSHYADGVLFAVLFAVGLSPAMPLPSTRLGNVAKSLLFGTILALLAIFVTAPFVFGPAAGRHDVLAGWHAGWNYMLSVLIWHWLYGLHLGLIYNPYDKSVESRKLDSQLS